MKKMQLLQLGLVVVLFFTVTSVSLAASERQEPDATLAATVRHNTEQFKDIGNAEAAGYSLFHGCVNGPQQGAMGVHYVNGDLVADGLLDEQQPEALLYEVKKDKVRLIGVEYVVLADDWHANHEGPPLLQGQLFNYVGSPNRYGIPAFYELHVWAWKHNTNGLFADWNPQVSCEQYSDISTEQEATP